MQSLVSFRQNPISKPKKNHISRKPKKITHPRLPHTRFKKHFYNRLYYVLNLIFVYAIIYIYIFYISHSLYISPSTFPSLSLLSNILFGISNGRFRPCLFIQIFKRTVSN